MLEHLTHTLLLAMKYLNNMFSKILCRLTLQSKSAYAPPPTAIPQHRMPLFGIRSHVVCSEFTQVQTSPQKLSVPLIKTNEILPPNPFRVRRACTNCKKSHTKCEVQRPCSRCLKRGTACVDSSTTSSVHSKTEKCSHHLCQSDVTFRSLNCLCT